MYSIKKGFPATDRVYEEIIYLVNNEDEKFTNNSTTNLEGDQIPILRSLAIDYIENAFKISEHERIEVSKDAGMKKIKNSTEIIDESVFEMVPLGGNSYTLPPGKSMTGNLIGHVSLIRTFLRHDLDRLKLPHFQWTKFELLPRVLLSIHAEYYKIDEINASFAKWIAFAEVHLNHPLDMDVFCKLLDILVDEHEDEGDGKKTGKNKIKKAWKKMIPFKRKKRTTTKEGSYEIIGDQLKTNDAGIEKLFCESQRFLVNSFLIFIKNLHNENLTRNVDANQNEDMQNEENQNRESIEMQNAAEFALKVNSFNKILEIINRTKKILLMDGTTKVLPDKNEIFRQMFKNFEIGTVEHFNEGVNKNLLGQRDEDEKKLNELVRIIKMVVDHREKFVGYYDQNFMSFSELSISKRLYEIYDNELATLIKPIVVEICQIKACNGNDDEFVKKEEAVIKKLFELYLELEKFVNYGKQHFVENKFETSQLYSWFSPGVEKFIKFFEFHARLRIIKSINADQLKCDFENGKMSSSVVDTMQTLYSIKRNWDVLKGLTKSKGGNLLKRIVDQFCNFAKIYFENFLDKLKSDLESRNIDILVIPIEFTVSVANYKYFNENFKKLIDELTTENLANRDFDFKYVENTQQNLKIIIHKFIEFSLQKCNLMIEKLLIEDIKEDKPDVGKVLSNDIEKILTIIFCEFPEREFRKSRLILWQNVVKILDQNIRVGLKNKRRPKFFSNVYKVFEHLKVAFRYPNDIHEDISMTRKVKKIDRLLERNRFSISELICQYYKYRHESQQKHKEDDVNLYGTLTVVCFIYQQNVLTIEIKSSQNLAPVHENEITNPYVKMFMIPKEKFPNPRKIKLQSHQNGNLVSKKRNIILKEDINIEESFIHFKIKHEESLMMMVGSFCSKLNCFGCKSAEEINSNFLGEAFLPFKDISMLIPGINLQEITLPLTKLQNCDLEPLKAIYQSAKAGNKQAIKFLKSLEKNSHISLNFEDDHRSEGMDL